MTSGLCHVTTTLKIRGKFFRKPVNLKRFESLLVISSLPFGCRIHIFLYFIIQ